MPKNYFELIDDKSLRFWEIEQKGSAVHLRWGKISTYGQSKVKELDSGDDAKNEVEKSIKQKTRKGYAKADPFDNKIDTRMSGFAVRETGEQKSVQGELYRKWNGIMHEYHGNGSGNWEADKYGVNRNGYSVEYLVDFVRKFLDDNPDTFQDYEEYKIEFLSDLPKCTSAEDVDDLTVDFELYEVWETLDFSKCTTTQEQLDSASIWDEYLNWLIRHLTENALPEWGDVTKDKLRNSFEFFRPEVPIGVISVESEEEWCRQNNKKSFKTGRDEIDAQEFIDKSIFSWIYQNPDLIDLKGKALGRNIVEIVTNEESLTGWAKKLCEWADNLPKSKSFFGGSDLPRNNDDLTNLDTLTLRGEKITELPKEIFNLTNLTTLDLSWNQLTEIPKEIDNLTNLSIRFKKFV